MASLVSCNKPRYRSTYIKLKSKMNFTRLTNAIKCFLILSIFFVNIACENVEQRVDLTSKEFSRLKTILEDGTWAWEENYCAKSPQTIVIDVDKRIMILTLDNLLESAEKMKDTFIYDIKWAWKTGFRGKIRNEESVDKNGQTIEWDLFVVDENSFYWRRSDWWKNAASKPILKCVSSSHKASKN